MRCLGITLSSTFALLLLTAPSLVNFSGPVVGVLDGDTIEVLHTQATYDKIMEQIMTWQTYAQLKHNRLTKVAKTTLRAAGLIAQHPIVFVL